MDFKSKNPHLLVALCHLSYIIHPFREIKAGLEPATNGGHCSNRINYPYLSGEGFEPSHITVKESKNDQAAYPLSGYYGAVQRRSSGLASASDVFVLHCRITSSL